MILILFLEEMNYVFNADSFFINPALYAYAKLYSFPLFFSLSLSLSLSISHLSLKSFVVGIFISCNYNTFVCLKYPVREKL